jgi:hypothetical protein
MSSCIYYRFHIIRVILIKFYLLFFSYILYLRLDYCPLHDVFEITYV